MRFNSKISRTNALDTIDDISEYARIFEYLWRNREEGENEESLMLMFKSRHGMRDTYAEMRGYAG
jgi:hypothetical protein